MQKIGLVVDEGADLPKEIIERYQIEITPLKMDWPDLESFPGENTFQKMRGAEKAGIKSFGKTSQPSPKDFLDIFKKQLTNFEKIIAITITSVHSGTYNSACQAKNFLEPGEKERVFVVDSLSGSAGQGLLTLKARNLIESGKEAEEIVKELEMSRAKIYVAAMLKDPKWLEASGRISHFLASWIRRMERIGLRPLLGIKNGKIKAVGIRRDAKDIPTALFREWREKTGKLLKQNKKIRVAITHADNLVEAQKLKEMIEEESNNTEVAFLNLIDNVLGIIVGPGSLILAWSEV
jgi:DegV family protein with EDD domain